MEGTRKRLWTVEEDQVLMEHILVHGKGKWNSVAKTTGLKRCGKSCRLRWINYLSPNVKRGHFSEQEDDLIIRLHKLLGNRWSLIAGRVPGRTDNQVKNHWNTRLSKKAKLSTEKTPLGISSSLLQASVKTEERLHNLPVECPFVLHSSKMNGGSDDEKVIENSSYPDTLYNYGNPIMFCGDYINEDLSHLFEYVDCCSLDFLWHDL